MKPIGFRSVLQRFGNLVSGGILLTTELTIVILEKSTRFIVHVIDKLCNSGKNTVRNRIKWHPQRYENTPQYKNTEIHELDSTKMFSSSTFPIAPESLIQLARNVMESEFGTKPGYNPDELLSSDFQFVAPIIGPLCKDEFIKIFGSFKLRDALPDLKQDLMFIVDPVEPNRVWFITRGGGTHSGPLRLAPNQVILPTNKKVMNPPQASSLLFDENGKCYTLTAGYTMDKRIGNTDGLGALFGILKAIGKPFPVREAQALYVPSCGFEALERFQKAFTREY